MVVAVTAAKSDELAKELEAKRDELADVAARRDELASKLDSAGAELNEHVAALHAWGRIARALTNVSGQVPMLLAVTGACVSGPALVIGLFDIVVMTEDAFAYVSGPDAATAFTGVSVDRVTLGGATVHARHSGVSTCAPTQPPK